MKATYIASTRHVMGVVICLAGFCAQGQTVNPANSVTLPDHVQIRSDGNMGLVTRQVELGQSDSPVMPDSIPVWTYNEGRWIRGVVAPSPAYKTHERPGTLLYDGKDYKLTRVRYVGVSCSPLHAVENNNDSPAKVVDEPSTYVLDNSETVPVRTLSVLATDAPRGANFDFIYQPQEDTYPQANLMLIRSVLSRVERRMELLLSNDGGFCRVNFSFSNQGLPPGASGFTFIASGTESYNLAKNNLLIFAQVDGEPNPEIAMYDFLPTGTSLQVKYTGIPQLGVSLVDVSLALRNKWGFLAEQVPEGITRMRPTTVWDYDPDDGINQGEQDFEKAVTHEAIHAIGFTSDVENPLTDDGMRVLTLWDLYRLDRDQVGPFASLFNIRNSVRMLDATVEAVGVIETNSLMGIPRLSRGSIAGGDGSAASHWKLFSQLQIEDPDATRIGIMDPEGLGPVQIPGYLSFADRGAIDQIGWAIDKFAGPQPPAADILQQPANAQDHVSYAPTLTWTPGTGANRRNVAVYRGADVVLANKVFDARSVAGNSITLPPGLLSAGETYSWFTTTTNDFAYTYAAKRTFTTFPTCNGDANGDRSVSFPDITSVLANFGNTYPPAPPGAFPGDADGNGLVAFPDVIASLAQFGASCP